MFVSDIINRMIARYTHGDIVWIDLESPTQGEVREMMKEFDVDPLIAEELLTPTLKPKVDSMPDYLYLILHFPAIRESNSLDSKHEIDFIIGKKFIITTRYSTIDPLHEFSKMFEVKSILDRENMGDHAGFIFFYMIKKLYQSVGNELAYLSDILRDINDKIFSGQEKEMVFSISHASRDLMNFKRTLGTHKDVLSSFEIAANKFYQNFSQHISAISGEYYHIQNKLDINADIITELRETNNSLVSTKQNEIMKVLTIMAFVTFPLSLMASIFGMNTETLPIVGYKHDFWIIIGAMLVFTLIFFTYFKYKKWL